MRRGPIPVLAALTVLVSAGCAPTPGGEPAAESTAARACLYTDRITNFRTGDDRRLYVRTLGDDVYVFSESGCLDLTGARALSIRSPVGGSSRLCPGDDAQIVMPSGSFGPNPCNTRLERRLTEAEVEALPPRSRP
jgi:hypothetical protein